MAACIRFEDWLDGISNYLQWKVQMLTKDVDTERGVNQYQVQFKTFSNLYLNHSIIYNEK
jgi:hypothetical protein